MHSQTGFNAPQPFPQPKPVRENFEYAPPRPHVWKTDEFQVKENNARPTEQINMVQPLANMDAVTNQTARQQPLAHYQQGNLAYGYRCPRCSSQLLPKIERKISNAGWVVFAALLVFVFPLFWIGLLIKEDVRVCPVCNLKIN
ncbi:MAG: LITAF-like zinc ribbon domain-containing protein [Pyrinomonadaceae bacterium]|nr:LITAF-like zinc ribbon domain-containing protein [Pyrinomonadaceae bacterium]